MQLRLVISFTVLGLSNMDAMTMGYKVNSPSLLKGLQSGDRVEFTLDTSKRVITKIEKRRN